MKYQKDMVYLFRFIAVLCLIVGLYYGPRIDWASPEGRWLLVFAIVVGSMYLAAYITLAWSWWMQDHDPVANEDLEIINAMWRTTRPLGPLSRFDWENWTDDITRGGTRYSKWKPGWNMDRVNREVLSNETLWDNFERDRTAWR